MGDYKEQNLLCRCRNEFNSTVIATKIKLYLHFKIRLQSPLLGHVSFTLFCAEQINTFVFVSFNSL